MLRTWWSGKSFEAGSIEQGSESELHSSQSSLSTRISSIKSFEFRWTLLLKLLLSLDDLCLSSPTTWRMPEQNVKDDFKNFAKPKNVVEIWTGYRRINARIEIHKHDRLKALAMPHCKCRIGQGRRRHDFYYSHFGNDEESFKLNGFDTKLGLSQFAMGSMKPDKRTKELGLNLINRSQQAECICLHSQC